MSCPVKLVGRTGALVASGQTVDISDGGTLIAVAPESAPAVGTVVDLSLEVPTGNPPTWPARVFSSKAKVVRHKDVGQPGKTGVAMEFLKPLKLDLRI
jgi:c-di-GMP-binding flagellar brake protein YcgR